MQTQRPSILSGGSALLGLLRSLPPHLLLAAASAVLLASPRELAAETTSAPLPSIFVAPLHGDSRIGFWQPAVGDGLAEMLITELTKLGKFRVLESTTLESIKDEIKMGDDGWIAPGEKVEKGQWKGADYMFVGKITRFACKSKSAGGGRGWRPLRLPIPIPVDGVSVTTMEAEVAIDWRVVDTASRDIIKTGRGQGKESGTSWGFGGSGGSGFVREHEFLDSALGKATVKAIDQIVAQLSQINIRPGTRAQLQQAKADQEAAGRQAAQDALHATPGAVKAVTPQFLAACRA